MIAHTFVSAYCYLPFRIVPRSRKRFKKWSLFACKSEKRFPKHPQSALRSAIDHLVSLEYSPVGATVDLHTLRHRLQKQLMEDGLPPEQVVDELVHDTRGGILGSAGGRFFSWVVGGSLPAALAAD